MLPLLPRVSNPTASVSFQRKHFLHSPFLSLRPPASPIKPVTLHSSSQSSPRYHQHHHHYLRIERSVKTLFPNYSFQNRQMMMKTYPEKVHLHDTSSGASRREVIGCPKHCMISRGLSLPPSLLWSLALTFIFGLFVFHSVNPLRFPSRNAVPQNHALISPRRDESICDLFKGQWMADHNGSIYTNSSCGTVPDSKNCFKNGRKDRDFLNWRWKPDGCELPRFDPHKYLQIVSGKKLAFVGDSVARNHLDSLLCLLSQAENPIDVYKDSEDHFRTWLFPAANFTLMIFWSKFLMKHEERVINGSNSGIFNLHLDKVDGAWATKLQGIDYAIISAGHWFFRKNYLYHHDNLVGCVYCNDPNITDFGVNYALRMAFRTSFEHVNQCKECKGMVTLLRTFSPAHFENGTWNTGGGCNRTSPYSVGEVSRLETYEWELRNLQVEELERAAKDGNGEREGKKFRVMDVTRAMLMRPDGHPGAYWGNKWMKGYSDCVHWCLPGPIDVWNDFLMASLQN